MRRIGLTVAVQLLAASSVFADLRAGAAAVDVTPPKLPVIVNGGFLSRTANKVVTQLHARAVVLDDGQARIAIVVVDSCMVPRDLLDRAKAIASEQTSIPTSHMLISATHTHSAPSAFSALGTPVDPDYPAFLTQRIANAIIAADGRLEPAEVGVAVVDADRFTAVRRWVVRPDRVGTDPFGNTTVRASMHTAGNPDHAVGPSGPEDPDLAVISVRSAEGRPIALVANFANHYVGAPMLSADYFGKFAERIGPAIGLEGDDGEAFVGMMSQGTSGDVWTRDYFQPGAAGWRSNLDTYTDGLVRLAADAYRSIEHRGDVTIAMAEAELRLTRRTPDAQRLEWARRIVAEMGDRLPRNRTEVYANSALKLHASPASTLKLQAIRVGDFGITAMPNEVYALTGLKLKRLSPLATTVNIELANGAEGYIPPPEQYALGGYTTWPAMSAGLETGAEPKIVETVAGLLEKVAGKPRRVFDPGAGPAAEAVIASKPVAYWRMHEWAGPAARDAIGGRDGVYEKGVAFFLEGPAGDRFHASGLDSELNRCAHFAGGRLRTRVPNLGDRYSVSLWFWNGLVTHARPVTGYLLSRGRDHAPRADGDHVGLGGTYGDGMTGKLFFFNGNERNEVLTGRSVVDRWTWHHVVFVRDGKHVRIYLDGKLEVEGEATMTAPIDVGQLFVGGRNDGFAAWEGRLDEVAVYDRAVTAEDAAKLYRAANAGASAVRPDTEPRSPAETIAVTHLRDGFAMQLVAAEPLVRDPVAIDWGPDGRLWVAEMADYPLGMTNSEDEMKPGARIRVLEDADGDGVFDRSTLFADGLNFANGVLVWGKGVLVTASTDVLYLEDTDGDGRADVREPLYTGFIAGNPQLRVNGLRSGLDNWVYCANGLHNRARIRSAKTGKTLTITGRDVRLRPDTGQMETAAGPSQFGRSMNDRGEWFGVDNSRPIWHVVIEDRYLRRNPHAPLPDPRNVLIAGRNPRVFPRSRFIKRYDHPHRGSLMTSACSTIVYRDELLFPRDRQQAFTCEPYHNLVLQMTLDDDGVSYAASFDRGADGNTEFLASEDGWFRPVQVRTGPDGALWVVDMYRYLIEHPKFMPNASREKLRPFFRLGEDRGRIYRVFRREAPPRRVAPIADASNERLVRELASPSGTRRDLAQRMLVRRGDAAALPTLREALAGDASAYARMHALCAIDGFGAITVADVDRGLADDAPIVRRQAVRLIESLEQQDRTATRLKRLAQLGADPDARVRLALAGTLGQMQGVQAGELMRPMLTTSDDPWLRAAAVSSLTPAVLQGFARSLDAPTAGRMGPDAWRDVVATAAGAGQRDVVERLLSAVCSGPADAHRLSCVASALDGLRSRRSLVETMRKDSRESDSAALREVTRVLAVARTIAGSPTHDLTDRSGAILLLGVSPFDSTRNVEALAQRIKPSESVEIQAAAIRAMGRSGHASTPGVLLERWAGAGPSVRPVMLDALLSRTPWTLAALDAIEQGRVDPVSIGAAHRDRMRASKDATVKARATKLLAVRGESSRNSIVKKYTPTLGRPGDAERGRAVFAKSCAVCHRIGEVGAAVGPDLLSVTDRSGPALLEAILDPNRSIDPRYAAYVVTLTDGANALGIVKSESGASVSIVDATGREHTFARSRIASMTSLDRSLMPEGLEAAIDERAMSDLIRFLQTAK